MISLYHCLFWVWFSRALAFFEDPGLQRLINISSELLRDDPTTIFAQIDMKKYLNI